MSELANAVSIQTYNAVYKKERPCEVINGQIVAIPLKGWGESLIRQHLADSLNRFMHESTRDTAFIAIVTLFEADQREGWVREARKFDISLISRAQIEEQEALYPDDALWQLAPLLVIDVKSPHNSDEYISNKIADCLRYGVQQVWIINWETQTVSIHTSDRPETLLTHIDTLTASPLVEGWSMPISDLFDYKR